MDESDEVLILECLLPANFSHTTFILNAGLLLVDVVWLNMIFWYFDTFLVNESCLTVKLAGNG